MQIGIVGKPSSGKSSFFKAATMIDVPIADYPFTTIKPNVGVGYVIADCVCKEFKVKCNPQNSLCIHGKRHVPVKLIDVAGLVPDAHLGKGMGNQFLDDLRQASCLIHTVDLSGRTDAEGKATEGHDPCYDIRFLTEEIDLWFAGIIEKGLEKYKHKSKFSKTDLLDLLTKQLTGLGITKEQISRTLDSVDISDTKKFSSELRKVSKPIIIAANKIDLPESDENFKKMRKEFPDLTIIPTCAVAEIALKTARDKGFIEYDGESFSTKEKSRMDEKQIQGLNFIKKSVIEKYGSTGIQDCLNKAVFDVLNHIVVYPVADVNKLTDTSGKNVLPDAFLVPHGTTLKVFAGKIHTDMVDKFIGGIDARTKKKLGADYELKNGNVIKVLFRD